MRMAQAVEEHPEGPPWGGYLTGCGGAMSKLAVRADGVIVPCGQIPGLELGAINKDELPHVWLNHPELNRFRMRRSIPLVDFPYCSNCSYIDFCTGNCPAISYSDHGSDGLYQPSSEGCFRRFLEQGGVLPDENVFMASGAV
jgi:radical SAM protein with 4Fe4S-binding SPASM domain